MMSNTSASVSKSFWTDFSKKTGTWSAVAGVAVTALELADNAIGPDLSQPGWHHVVAVIGAAVIRAVIGLIQGKVGNPATAKFDKAEPAPAPAPASADLGD